MKAKEAINKAYAELLYRIEAGEEYPDAHTAVRLKYKLGGVGANMVQSLYDQGAPVSDAGR